jgi:hypothetical protein
MKPAKDVTVDFDNGTTRKMIVYDDGIFMDTGILMAKLNEYLRNKILSLYRKKLTHLLNLMENLSSIVLDLVPVSLIMMRNWCQSKVT